MAVEGRLEERRLASAEEGVFLGHQVVVPSQLEVGLCLANLWGKKSLWIDIDIFSTKGDLPLI